MSAPTIANSKLILEKLSYSKLINKWRLRTSKKLLIIRPNVPGDNYTVAFSNLAAEQVKSKAIAEGWTVTDLQGTNANRTNIEQTINDVKPDFIIHYDHGSSFTLYGQNGNSIVPALDAANVNLLTGKAVSTVSCESAIGLVDWRLILMLKHIWVMTNYIGYICGTSTSLWRRLMPQTMHCWKEKHSNKPLI